MPGPVVRPDSPAKRDDDKAPDTRPASPGAFGTRKDPGGREPGTPAPASPGGAAGGAGVRTAPGRTPGVGSVIPGRTPSSPSIADWRPVNRGNDTRGAGGVRNNPGSVTGSRPGGDSPLIGHDPVVPSLSGSHWAPRREVRPDTRPPQARRDRWYDWRPGVRPITTVSFGYWNPGYRYNWGIWIGTDFYYPYYYCGPYRPGFYYSPYWCYDGWFPGYLWPERVIYIERRVYLRDVVTDTYDYYGVTSSLTETLEDIRSAWLRGEGGRLLRHIGDGLPVRVYRDARYEYSVEPEDFRDMSKDAISRVETESFEWTKIQRRASDEVHVVAKHVFRDPDGDRRVVKLSYTLEKAAGFWWITETGTDRW